MCHVSDHVDRDERARQMGLCEHHARVQPQESAHLDGSTERDVLDGLKRRHRSGEKITVGDCELECAAHQEAAEDASGGVALLWLAEKCVADRSLRHQDRIATREAWQLEVSRRITQKLGFPRRTRLAGLKRLLGGLGALLLAPQGECLTLLKIHHLLRRLRPELVDRRRLAGEGISSHESEEGAHRGLAALLGLHADAQ